MKHLRSPFSTDTQLFDKGFYHRHSCLPGFAALLLCVIFAIVLFHVVTCTFCRFPKASWHIWPTVTTPSYLVNLIQKLQGCFDFALHPWPSPRLPILLVTVSTITTKRFSPPLLTRCSFHQPPFRFPLLLLPVPFSHPFSHPFSFPFFPFSFRFSLFFPLPCPFSCHDPYQPSADTFASESPALVLAAAISIGGLGERKLFVSGTSAG